jgi:hypothetical protein
MNFQMQDKYARIESWEGAVMHLFRNSDNCRTYILTEEQAFQTWTTLVGKVAAIQVASRLFCRLGTAVRVCVRNQTNTSVERFICTRHRFSILCKDARVKQDELV